MTKKGRIGHYGESGSVTQEAIEQQSKMEAIEELTLVFPRAFHSKDESFPLNTLDFSPLEALKNLEQINIELLLTDTLLPILKHVRTVSCVSLRGTGPITSSLLEELTACNHLKRLELIDPPGKLVPEILRSLTNSKSLETLWLDGVVVG